LKKFIIFALIIAVFCSFSPLAFAMDILDKPSAGQVIFIEADNDLDYKADFPVSALTGAFREDNDLRLEFPAARLTLKGFFVPRGEWRSLSFSDGGSIGGASFDEDGKFTGSFHSVLDLGKTGQGAKLDANSAQMETPTVVLSFSPYGTKVQQGAEEIWGEMRERTIEAVQLIYPVEKPDWSIVNEQRFEFFTDEDGSLSPLRSYTDFTDGIRAEIINPERVYLSGSLNLQPVSEGRASICFKNRLGNELLKLDVRCKKDTSGALHIISDCSGCKEELDGGLHYMPCGHYSCGEGFDPSVHGLAQCGTAGHCISEDGHEKCSNCLGFTCDGRAHGLGLCEHVHNWVATSLLSSRCTGCGYVYTRQLN